LQNLLIGGAIGLAVSAATVACQDLVPNTVEDTLHR
jgi:hypothetical protein